MNIHLPAILMFTRGTRFWHTAMWDIAWRGAQVPSDSDRSCLTFAAQRTGQFERYCLSCDTGRFDGKCFISLHQIIHHYTPLYTDINIYILIHTRIYIYDIYMYIYMCIYMCIYIICIYIIYVWFHCLLQFRIAFRYEKPYQHLEDFSLVPSNRCFYRLFSALLRKPWWIHWHWPNKKISMDISYVWILSGNHILSYIYHRKIDPSMDFEWKLLHQFLVGDSCWEWHSI